jgi:predicted aconitase with swiveling domain
MNIDKQMKDIKTIKGRGVISGSGEGRALISRQPFMFAHGVDPKTGNIIDVRSDLFGKNIRNKVLIFPYGKGSTTGSAWLLETIRQGNGPAAVINLETEPIIASAIVMARILYGITIPLVDRLKEDITDIATEKTVVRVNGKNGVIDLLPSP